MKNPVVFACVVLALLASPFTIFANAIWTAVPRSTPQSLNDPDIQTTSSAIYQVNLVQLEAQLAMAPEEGAGVLPVYFPMPDGSFRKFEISRTPVVPAELRIRYPRIHTWSGIDPLRPGVSIHLDMTYQGFHAMVLDPEGDVFIDPWHRTVSDYVQVYYRRDAIPDGDAVSCGFVAGESRPVQLSSGEKQPPSALRSNGITLRTYRAAIACTGEYAAFHGGTKPTALSAIVTSLNRVTGVYEKEFSVRMTLVPNNDTVIFLNAATDPYTNNSGGTMLTQNQQTIALYIGNGFYEIGHVFSTGGGGIAGLGVVCSPSQKARGVTGSGSPVNDPFDIDYVAHEMGHQFGANHTFNGTTGGCSGNINVQTAYEPGSGTTIMAYAGLCTGQNMQNFSDPYFHTASFDEVLDYILTSTGGICPVSSPTGNNPPVILSTGGDHVIPCNTPFVLSGNAADPDGDSVYYCWEQYDLGPSGSPAFPVGNAPLFRSFNPTPNAQRYFPKLSALVNNSNSVGERLPTYNRSLHFRLTARDNRSGGGGVTYEDVAVTIDAVNTGVPFQVTAPNTAVSWTGNTQELVTWNVAGTDTAPISTSQVEIYLSIDGGFTYPYLVAAGLPNNGSALINVPGVNTSSARIMVRGGGNVFFDISDVNFSINTVIGLNEVDRRMELRLAPNPANDRLTLASSIAIPGNADVFISDASGRVVIERNLSNSDLGVPVELSLDGIASGLYTVRLIVAGYSASALLVVNR
ncbi:MAG: reprolysin-like metallopeptidase [Bacteroidota bacterium]